MHQYKKFKEHAFALPTLVIVSTILLIAGMSSLQAASSIGKSLQDIRWNSLANSAAEAGINYAASCLEEDEEVYENWGSSQLRPNTNCEGGSPSGSVYIENDEDGRWRSTFSVANVPQGEYEPPKIISTGTVQRLNSSENVIKTYQAKKDIILNLPGASPISVAPGGTSLASSSYDPSGYTTPSEFFGGGICLVASDSKFYCARDYATSSNGFPDFIAHRIDGGDLGNLSVKSAVGNIAQGCTLAVDSQVYCISTGNSVPSKLDLPSGLSAREIVSKNSGLFNFGTCVVASNDQTYCMGLNDYGQLGDGTTTNRSTPVKFNLPTSPVALTTLAVALGGDHNCALASDYQVYCAGQNNIGQLGDGTTTNRSTPVKFNLPTSPVALTAKAVGTIDNADSTTCVLASDNQAYCVGGNYYGQLGIGNTTNQSTASTPFELPTGLAAKQLAVQRRHTCVLASDNQAYCAGANYYGQLGDGTSTDRSTPVKFELPGSLLAKRVVTASDYTCVLASDDQVYCAGKNDYGQLGDGTTTNRSTPVKFNLPSGITVVYISQAGSFLCVQTSDNRVYCAGDNTGALLGSGTNATPQVTPLPILY